MTGRGSTVRDVASGLIVGAALIAAVSVLIAVLEDSVDPVGLTGLYLFAILPVAIRWGFVLAGCVAIASFLTFGFFFSPPLHSFRIAETDTEAPLAIALVTAYLVSELARRATDRARDARARASEAEDARDDLRTLAAEQAALRRVATLVAQGVATTQVFESVTGELGLLFDADLARMERFEPDGTVTAIAAWSRSGEGRLAVGTRFALEGASIAARVHETGRPARVDTFAGASGPIAREAQALGIRSSVGCPIVVGGRTWGVIAASSTREASFPPDTESRIADFTELAATAIANAEAREELRQVADEQAALRRVATLVARAAPEPAVFAAAVEEVGRLLEGITALCRFDADDMFTMVATWGPPGARVPAAHERFPRDAGPITKLVRDTGRSERIDRYADAGDGATVAATEYAVRSAIAAPIVLEEQLWGALVVGSTGEDPAPPGTEERLAGFAELIATAIAKALSQAALRASRARIVTTADETRRRIERDLHDGAQQRLVSLALRMRGVRDQIPPPLADLAATVDDVRGEITDVLDELREMSRGLHPPILAKGGLDPALKTLARHSALPVQLDVRAKERLPQPVEVGAYYVVSEALTNAAKHARATSVDVEVEPVDGMLRVSVRDDGVGGADFTRGSGLVGLKDRVEALGGRIAVESPRDSGTSIRVELPLSGEPPG